MKYLTILILVFMVFSMGACFDNVPVSKGACIQNCVDTTLGQIYGMNITTSKTPSPELLEQIHNICKENIGSSQCYRQWGGSTILLK